MDGLGIGELPDADEYGDKGCNTLKNISETKKLNIPNLLSLGLGNISTISDVIYSGEVIGCFGKMSEKSKGKDSTTGHWEIGGYIMKSPFPVYPEGFNKEIVEKFKSLTGFKDILGNKPASGTEIVKELGEEHVRTGYPIVYTSADSVFQIAAHEEVIPLKRLYEICSIVREKIMIGKDAVARIIARPFIGDIGNFVRTANRRDFSLKPPAKLLLDFLQEGGINTIGIGKIDDLYAGQGLNVKIHTRSNKEGIEVIIDLLKRHEDGFIFINLVDFDMLYGHRNDAKGFADALEYFDYKFSTIMNLLSKDDLVIITADHGNDPGDISTDHTREYVPLLTYSKSSKTNINLGIRSGFSDIASTIMDFYKVGGQVSGISFLNMIY